MLGVRALKSTRVASKSLNLFVTSFKRRKDFASDNSYANYVRKHLKPNMLVMCNQHSYWSKRMISAGSVGLVVSCETGKQPLINWDIQDGTRQGKGEFDYLDILTLPIKCDLIVD